MRPPSLGDWYALDESAIRTEYLRRKAARLASDPTDRVTHLEWDSTVTTQVFAVRGDSAVYRVWLRPLVDPWAAACSRGGAHDFQPDDQPCSHGLAAAARWVGMNPNLRATVEAVVKAGETGETGDGDDGDEICGDPCGVCGDPGCVCGDPGCVCDLLPEPARDRPVGAVRGFYD